VAAVAVLIAVFCVAAGWHWKAMHRSWQDLRQVKDQARGKIPALKTARSHNTSVATVFAVIAVVIIAALLHLGAQPDRQGLQAVDESAGAPAQLVRGYR
jgi:hypothetical protein